MPFASIYMLFMHVSQNLGNPEFWKGSCFLERAVLSRKGGSDLFLQTKPGIGIYTYVYIYIYVYKDNIQFASNKIYMGAARKSSVGCVRDRSEGGSSSVMGRRGGILDETYGDGSSP